MINWFTKNKENADKLKKEVVSLRSELDKRGFNLSVLYSVGEDISSILDIDLLLKMTADMFVEIMRAKSAAILLDNEASGFKVSGYKGEEKNSLGHIQLDRKSGLVKMFSQINQPLAKKDILTRGYKLTDQEDKIFEELNTAVLAPFMFKGQMIGLLSLGSRENQEIFREDDYELLATLTTQIAVAISNARLYKKLDLSRKELDKKISDLTILHQMSKTISSVLDLDKLKELVMDVFLEISHVGKGVLFLLNDDESALISSVLYGFRDDQMQDVKFPIDSVFAEKIISEKELMIFSEGCSPKDLADYQFSDTMVKEMVSSGLVLYLPLLATDRLVGLIALGSKLDNQEFSLSELQLLSTLSSQVAVTIENARLYELAIRDGLTKVYIHRYFQQQLDYEIKRSNRYKREVSLIMLDIDNFKSLNDNYGHQLGDHVLKEVSRILKESFRGTDIICRYGGDEFAVIMPEIDITQAKVASERVRETISNHDFGLANAGSKITVSMGISTYPDFASTKEDFIRKADQALYKSKREGRNRVSLCISLNS